MKKASVRNLQEEGEESRGESSVRKKKREAERWHWEKESETEEPGEKRDWGGAEWSLPYRETNGS